MRGVRSLIVLLVIAIPLGWYAYRDFDEAAPGDDGRRRDKVFTVEPDKIEEISIKSESGERTRLQKSGTEWKIVAPAGAASPTPPRSPARDLQPVVARDRARRSTRTRRISRSTAWRSRASRSRSSRGGQEQTLLIGQKTPPGTDLYAKRADDNEGLPDPGASRIDLQQDDVRPARQVGAEGRSRQARRARAHGRRSQTSKFAKPAGEWQIAAPVQARADFSAIEGLVSRLAGLQMKSRSSTPPDADRQEVRPRQAGGDGAVRRRLVAGDRSSSAARPPRARSTRRICRGRRSSRSNRASSTS